LIDGGVRYVYGFSATQEKIIDEWLYQYPKGSPQKDRPFNLSIAEKIVANDSLFNCTAVDKNNELSLVLSCQIFFLPLSTLIVPHWFVDFLSIRFCGLPYSV
jgi:hypothetical protein